MTAMNAIKATRCGLARAAFLTALVLTLAGCVDSISHTELPELKAEKKVLTKDEQAQAMADLRRKSEQQSADVLRQIETGSNRPKTQ